MSRRKLSPSEVAMRLEAFNYRKEMFALADHLPSAPPEEANKKTWRKYVSTLRQINKDATTKLKAVQKKCEKYSKELHTSDQPTLPSLKALELWTAHHSNLKKLVKKLRVHKKAETSLRKSMGNKGLPPRPDADGKGQILDWKRSKRKLHYLKMHISPMMTKAGVFTKDLKGTIPEAPETWDIDQWRDFVKDVREWKNETEEYMMKGTYLRKILKGNDLPKEPKPMDHDKWESHNEKLNEMKTTVTALKEEITAGEGEFDKDELPPRPKGLDLDAWEDYRDALEKLKETVEKCKEQGMALIEVYKGDGWGAEDLPDPPSGFSQKQWLKYADNLKNLKVVFAENQSKGRKLVNKYKRDNPNCGIRKVEVVEEVPEESDEKKEGESLSMAEMAKKSEEKKDGDAEKEVVYEDKPVWPTAPDVPTKKSPKQWQDCVDAYETLEANLASSKAAGEAVVKWLKGNEYDCSMPDNKCLEEWEKWVVDLGHVKKPIQEIEDEWFNDIEPGIPDANRKNMIGEAPEDNNADAWREFLKLNCALNPAFRPKPKPIYVVGLNVNLKDFSIRKMTETMYNGFGDIIEAHQAETPDELPWYMVQLDDVEAPVKCKESQIIKLPDPIEEELAIVIKKMRKERGKIAACDVGMEKAANKVKKIQDKIRNMGCGKKQDANAEKKQRALRTKAAMEGKKWGDKRRKTVEVMEGIQPELYQAIEESTSLKVYVDGVMNARAKDQVLAVIEDRGVNITESTDIGPSINGFEMGLFVFLKNRAQRMKLIKIKYIDVSPQINNEKGIIKIYPRADP